MLRAKAFFLGMRETAREVRILKARSRKYMEMATTFSSVNMSGVHGSGHSSPTERAAVELAAVSEKLDKIAESYARTAKLAEEIIEKLPKQKYRSILTKAYVEDKRWKVIAKELGVEDMRSLFRSHGRALEAADEVLKRLYPTLDDSEDAV